MSRRPSQAELLAAAEALAGLNSVAPSTAGSPTTHLSPTQAHATLPTPDAPLAEQSETKVASTKRKATDADAPQNEEEEEEEEEQEEDDDDEEYEDGSAKAKGERQWYDQIANAGDSSDKTNSQGNRPPRAKSQTAPKEESADESVDIDSLPPEQRLKALFNREYNGYHEIKNIPHQRPSVMRNKEVDLCKLYDIVMRKGGSDKVTGTNAWRDVYNALNNVTNASTNVSYYTRLAYDKHLTGFEAFMKSHGANKTTPLTNACEQAWEHLRKTLPAQEFELRWAARKRKRGWREWGKHAGKKANPKKSRKKKEEAGGSDGVQGEEGVPPTKKSKKAKRQVEEQADGELLGPERPEISPEDEGKLRHDLLPLLHRVYASHHHPATYSAPMMMGSAFTADQTIYGIDPHGFNTSSPYVPSSDTESSGSGQVPSAPLAHSPKQFTAHAAPPLPPVGNAQPPKTQASYHHPFSGGSMGGSGVVTPTGQPTSGSGAPSGHAYTANHYQAGPTHGPTSSAYASPQQMMSPHGSPQPTHFASSQLSAAVLQQAAAVEALAGAPRVSTSALYGPMTTTLAGGDLLTRVPAEAMGGEVLLPFQPSAGENKHIFHMQLLKDCYKELAGEMSTLKRQIRDTSTLKTMIQQSSTLPSSHLSHTVTEDQEDEEEEESVESEEEEEDIEEVEEEHGHVASEDMDMSSEETGRLATPMSKVDMDDEEEEIMMEGHL